MAKKRKVLVLDTSVLLHDPNCIEKFEDNIVVIPIWAIEELDGKKKLIDQQVGADSRYVSRLLDEYRELGSLRNGVEMKNGGILIIDYNGTDFSKLPVQLERNRDNRILLVAMAWKESCPRRPQQNRSKKSILTEYEFSEVSIITKDINLRLKADACGINADDYKNDKHISSAEFLYTGIAKFDLPSSFDFLLDGSNEIWRTGTMKEKIFCDEILLSGLLYNQCCYFNVNGKTIHTIYEKDAGVFKIIKTPTSIKGKVLPINIEQAMLYNLAMDPEIFLVTSGGYAGTGKTLMALAAGYEQLGKTYEQIIVYRPNCPLGQDLGFLPGDIGEKFAPWMLPILDNMHLILGKNENYSQKDGEFSGKSSNPIMELMREKLLEISPINFLRGRSINNGYIIIDEAQNLTPHEAKTIVSRAGGGTKIILTGDIMQIDNPHVDSISNGLTHTIESMKGVRRFGHVTLSKSERSELAELAATRM